MSGKKPKPEPMAVQPGDEVCTISDMPALMDGGREGIIRAGARGRVEHLMLLGQGKVAICVRFRSGVNMVRPRYLEVKGPDGDYHKVQMGL